LKAGHFTKESSSGYSEVVLLQNIVGNGYITLPTVLDVYNIMIQNRRDTKGKSEAQPSVYQTCLVGVILRSLHTKKVNQNEMNLLSNVDSLSKIEHQASLTTFDDPTSVGTLST